MRFSQSPVLDSGAAVHLISKLGPLFEAVDHGGPFAQTRVHLPHLVQGLHLEHRACATCGSSSNTLALVEACGQQACVAKVSHLCAEERHVFAECYPKTEKCSAVAAIALQVRLAASANRACTVKALRQRTAAQLHKSTSLFKTCDGAEGRTSEAL